MKGRAKLIVLVIGIILIIAVSCLIVNNKNTDKPNNTPEKTEAFKTTEKTEKETYMDISLENNNDTQVVAPLSPNIDDNNFETSSISADSTSETIETESYISYTEESEETTEMDLESANKEVQSMEAKMDENIRVNTHNDTIELMKVSLKTEVKKLVASGHTEFGKYTDEYIDNCTEDEADSILREVMKEIN